MRLSVIRTMKLLTHNMLTSHVKGVKNGYPLKIEVENMNVTEVDFNPDFIARMIPRLEWKALYESAQMSQFLDLLYPIVKVKDLEGLGMLNVVGNLPSEPVADYESNEDFLKEAHRVMLEVEVTDGFLVCPESGRKFPIKNGIPNMLLNEDEV